jgi:aminoglycoside 6-adenylyltransferase
MDDFSPNFDPLITKLLDWAGEDANIRAMAVIGSHARLDHPADEWSDLDILLIAADPESYLYSTGWIDSIAQPWLVFREPTPDGRGLELRVLFEGGLDVDFVPISSGLARAMLEGGVPADVADLIYRGIRFLVDKDGFSEQIQRLEIEQPRYAPPTEAEFLQLITDFWYHAVWTAKHLRRGELWWAKACCDGYLKELLRRTLEWRSHREGTGDVDTWMRGRFLEEWADPRAVSTFKRIYGHYDKADIWRALWETMTLFRWVARETADCLNFSYPFDGDTRATELVARFTPANIERLNPSQDTDTISSPGLVF